MDKMTANLVYSLSLAGAVLQTAILEIDKVLSAGRWRDGTELTVKDVDWLRDLSSRLIATRIQ